MVFNTHRHGRPSLGQPGRGIAVVLIALTSVLAIVGVAPRPSSTARIGFSPGGSFALQSPGALQRDLARMAESGGHWVRLDIDWSRIEPVQGTFDWTTTDRAIASARDAGLEVIGLVTYTPAWTRPSGTSSHWPPDESTTFAAFTGTAAARYAQQVGTWEIWNEPNLVTFWSSGPDPERYARLLVDASAAVRRADPSATILSGGLASVPDLPPARIDPITFVRNLYAAGAGPAFDGVSIHPYTYPTLPSRSPDGMFLRLPDLHALMVDRGDAEKGIWITEFGSPTGNGPRAVTPEQQAEILDAAFTVARSYPWVRSFLVYSLRDAGRSPDDIEQNFGLRTVDDIPKPAWDVFVRRAELR